MQALRQLLCLDRSAVTLDRAALDLAAIEYPDLDPAPCLKELDDLALAIAERTPNLDDGRAFLRAANRHLFGELGFRGSEDQYYDPRNSCLNYVLMARTGIPITLSLVYMEVARRLARPVYGINAPGHFLIQYDDGATSAYIDPYHSGRLLNRDQCLELAGRYTRNADEQMLTRATPRQILVRMLRNLEGAYVRLGAFEKAVVVGDLLQSAGIARHRSLPSSNSTAN